MTPPLRLNRIRTHIPELAAESDLPSVKKLWTVEKRLGSWDDVTQKFFSNHVWPRGRLDGHGPQGWIGEPPRPSLIFHTDNQAYVCPYKETNTDFSLLSFSRLQGILDKIQTDVAVRQHQQRTGKLVNMGSR